MDHGNGVRTLYAHCSKLLVKKGQRVVQGQRLATVGRTGRATCNHLHFVVYVKARREILWNISASAPRKRASATSWEKKQTVYSAVFIKEAPRAEHLPQGRSSALGASFGAWSVTARGAGPNPAGGVASKAMRAMTIHSRWWTAGIRFRFP